MVCVVVVVIDEVVVVVVSETLDVSSAAGKAVFELSPSVLPEQAVINTIVSAVINAISFLIFSLPLIYQYPNVTTSHLPSCSLAT